MNDKPATSVPLPEKYLREEMLSFLIELDDRFKILEYLVVNRLGNVTIATIRDLSNSTGLSTARINSSLKLLEEKGFIERYRNGILRLSDKLLYLFGENLNSQHKIDELLIPPPAMSYRCKLDGEWTMDHISGGCFTLTGYNSDYFIHNKVISYNDIIIPKYQEEVWLGCNRAIENKLPFNCEYEILTASGQRKWVLETGQGVYTKGNLQALEGVIFDINFLKESEFKVNYLKRHDIWTGLYNRNYLAHTLKNDMIKLANQTKCVIVINISELSTTTNFFESQNIVKDTASALTAYFSEDCQLYKTFLNRITFYLKRYSSRNDIIRFIQKIKVTLKSNNINNAGIGIYEIDELDVDIDYIFKNVLAASEEALLNSKSKFNYCFYNKSGLGKAK